MAAIPIDIHIADPVSVLALYDRIEMWKAATELGSYTEITAAAPLPAVIEGTVGGPWNLSGMTLTIARSGTDPIPFVFSGTNPLDLASVLAQINAVFADMAAQAATPGRLKLSSPTSGTGASLQLGGAAAAVLGLSTSKVNGKAARLNIVAETTDYRFQDFDGLTTDWYKTRYRLSAIGAVSSYGTPQQGTPQTVLPAGSMSLCTVALADAAGLAIVRRKIILTPVAPRQVMSGSQNYGVLPGVDRIEMTTNARGYAETSLVRGQRFKVFFEGYAYEREFEVPNAETFDLLTVISTSPDPFTPVSVPPRPIRMDS